MDDRIFVSEEIELIRRGKKKTYVARFRHNGRSTKISMKTSNLAVARKRAIVLAGQLSDGAYQTRPSAAGATTPAAMSISDAVMKFIAHKATIERCRTKTTYKHKSVLNAFAKWAAGVGVTDLNDLSVPHFRRFEASYEVARTAHDPLRDDHSQELRVMGGATRHGNDEQ